MWHRRPSHQRLVILAGPFSYSSVTVSAEGGAQMGTFAMVCNAPNLPTTNQAMGVNILIEGHTSPLPLQSGFGEGSARSLSHARPGR